jgi:ribosomal protein S27AE
VSSGNSGNADPADVGAVASAKVAGEANRCPHCGGQTVVLEDPLFRFACGVCGGPRIPVKDVRGHTAKEKQLLVAADHARKTAFGFRMLATGLGLTGTLVAALSAALATLSIAVGVGLAAVAIILFVLTVTYAGRARKKIEDAKRGAFEAWETVAETVLRLHGGNVSTSELAELLGTNEAEAERVMTVLSVDDRVRVDVGKDAELRYRVPEAPGPEFQELDEAEHAAAGAAAEAAREAVSKSE